MYGTQCQKEYGLGNTTFHEEAGKRICEVFDFYSPLIFDEHLIYTINNEFRGCKILLLGGGGSTNRWLDSNSVAGYDSIWSLNGFYKNPKIQNLKVDLFSVGPEVDLQSSTLLDYLYKHNTIAAVELHQKWGRTFNNPETNKTPQQMSEEINAFYVKDRKKVFQTKFYSQLGGGVRLLIYAAHIGVAKIDFIGFDGAQAILNGDHAFEPNKKKFPGAVQHMSDNTKVEFFKQQYSFFWQYFRTLYGDIAKSLDGNPLHANR